MRWLAVAVAFTTLSVATAPFGHAASQSAAKTPASLRSYDYDSLGSKTLRVSSSATGRIASFPHVCRSIRPESSFGVAAKGGAEVVRLGQAGEAAVRGVYDIGPRATRVINGRVRIFDGLTDDAVSEAKNVSRLSYTKQLRDYAAYAADAGLRLDIYVRSGTKSRSAGPCRS